MGYIDLQTVYILAASIGKGRITVKRYVCKVCGYVYDPESGDPIADVAPGTPFEDISDDWVCPICGADKSQFFLQT